MDCRLRDGVWRVEHRLVWDYLGGGIVVAPDLGAEPDLRSDQPGSEFGPWGHRVSNYAVNGAYTGFRDFFEASGGVAFFGYPKTEARDDGDPAAVLRVPGATPGVIRQHFQASVLEYHPGDAAQPVKLALLGDAVRDRLYPGQGYRGYSSFGPADPLTSGETYVPERTMRSGGSLSVR